MPLRHRHDYAAGIRRGLPGERHKPIGEFTVSADTVAHRGLAQIRQVRASGIHLRGVQPLVSHVHLSVLLAGPDRSDGAAAVPALSGLLSTLPGVSRVRLPSVSPARCDGPEEKVSHLLSVQERLVALEVGHPEPVGLVRAELALDEVGGAVQAPVEAGGDLVGPTPAGSRKAQLTHKALDGAARDPDALTVELGPDLVGP